MSLLPIREFVEKNCRTSYISFSKETKQKLCSVDFF